MMGQGNTAGFIHATWWERHRVQLKHWDKLFFVHALLMILDGFISLITLGFFWPNTDMKWLVWKTEREFRLERERDGNIG